MPRLSTVICLVALLSLPAATAAGCGGTGPNDQGRLGVVAAEDFWGSIAAELGGDRVEVTDLVTNPAADPHDYEPTAEDARAMATAEVAIVNGLGYDSWARKLLDADPDPDREVIDVGEVLGLSDGDNPHQWYSPSSVERAIRQITADYKRADPGHDAFYEARRRSFEQAGLARYHRLLARIRSRYGGTPVGGSESILAPLAAALGLKLVTPGGLLAAVSEGTEPTPADRARAERQISSGEIAVWIYNSQNATPDVQRLNQAAEAAGIPVVTVTETTTPEGATFQAWQSRQLERLLAALGEGSAGR